MLQCNISMGDKNQPIYLGEEKEKVDKLVRYNVKM